MSCNYTLVLTCVCVKLLPIGILDTLDNMELKSIRNDMVEPHNWYIAQVLVLWGKK